MNIKMKFAVTMAILVLFQIGCTQKTPTDLTKTSFIPKPVSVTATGDAFKIESSTVIFVQDGLQQKGQYLANALNEISGFTLEVKNADEAPQNGIYLTISAEKNELKEEGYQINIDKKLVTIAATTEAGCFNGRRVRIG